MGFTDAVLAELRDGDVLSAEEKAHFVLAGFVKAFWWDDTDLYPLVI